jgi:DNA-binding beta-propeller fold protein YncE
MHTGRADHMALSGDGRTIFAAALTDNAVYRIATQDGAVTGHFATGQWSHDTKFSVDGKRVYNSSTGAIPALGVRPTTGAPTGAPDYPYQLTIADPASLKVLDRIKLDTPFRPWAFAPDGRSVYAELSNQRVVVAYDLDQRKVVRRLELSPGNAQPIADWMFAAPYHGLALTPDGKTLCLAGRETDSAPLVAAPSLTLVADVKVGKAPGWAEIADGGRVCLLTNTRSNDLSIVSIAERKEVARVPVGKGPRHVRAASVPASVIAVVQARSAPR